LKINLKSGKVSVLCLINKSLDYVIIPWNNSYKGLKTPIREAAVPALISNMLVLSSPDCFYFCDDISYYLSVSDKQWETQYCLTKMIFNQLYK